MPRVPEYNQRQIELTPANTPYQDMKPTAEQFGSDLGQAMQNLGKSLGSVAGTLGDTATYLHKVEQEKNETAAVDLFNQYTAAQSKIADSYQTLSGKLAVDGYAATEKQLSVLKRDYLSRAANPAQAELLSKAMEAGSATTLGQMQRYRDQQQGVYEDDVSDTRVGLMLGNVRRFYNDDRESAKSVYLAQVESLDQLRRHNAGTEEIKAKLKQVASTGMRQRIEGAMAQQDLGLARRLFDGHADGLLAPDRDAMAAQLGHLEFNDRVENETTRILQASPLRLGGEQHGKTATEPSPPDAEQRLALAEKIADPQLRAAVQDRVALQNQRDRQAYLTQQRQMKVQAKDIIDRGGAFTDIPYQMLIGIDATGKAALSAYARSGGKVTTDPVVYYGLKNLALDDPQAFLDVDLNDHLSEIDAKDFATLDQLQQSLRGGNHDPQLDLERVYKDNIDRTLRGLDLSATDIAKLYYQIDRDLAGYQAAIGRKTTPAEQQQMVDQAVMNMKLDQHSFVMTRYGAIVSTMGNAANANANSLIIQTAGGDMGFPDKAEPQEKRESGSLEDLFEGQEPLVTGPDGRVIDAADLPKNQVAPWLKDGAFEKYKGILPYPDGGLLRVHPGERKTAGPLAKEAEKVIWTLQPANIWPIEGDIKINKRNPPTASGFYTKDDRKDKDGMPRPHGGIDITAEAGQRVNVVKDGTVVWIREGVYPGQVFDKKSETYNEDRGYGNLVIVQHDDGMFTVYAHLQDHTEIKGGRPVRKSFVKNGDKVVAGQQIGEVGRTGNLPKDGQSHLHFEVRYKNAGRQLVTRTTINPLYYLPWLGISIYSK